MMEADRNDADDAVRPFASSACFAHEAEGGQLDTAARMQGERRAEIMAWRKGASRAFTSPRPAARI